MESNDKRLAALAGPDNLEKRLGLAAGMIVNITIAKAYDHRPCIGRDADGCPNCGHSIFVFHAGNAPCFHREESHEEAALRRAREGKRELFPLPFCGCDGPGEAAMPAVRAQWRREEIWP